MSQEEIVRAAHVVIRFDGRRCIRSRHCVLDRPDVFVPNTAPRASAATFERRL